MMKKVAVIDEMTLIKMYEFGYISRKFFLEQLLGCGQQTIATEGEARFTFYIERESGLSLIHI